MADVRLAWRGQFFIQGNCFVRLIKSLHLTQIVNLWSYLDLVNSTTKPTNQRLRGAGLARKRSGIPNSIMLDEKSAESILWGPWIQWVQRIEMLDCMNIHPEFLQLACLLIKTKSNPSVLILKKLLFHCFSKTNNCIFCLPKHKWKCWLQLNNSVDKKKQCSHYTSSHVSPLCIKVEIQLQSCK